MPMRSTPPERARTEMTVLASLDHPALREASRRRRDPGRPQYLVMEFVEGTNLAERINGGPVPPDLVAHLTVRTGLRTPRRASGRDRASRSEALQRAGRVEPGAGATQPRVKLADFGVAYLMDSTRVTTPEWSSEQRPLGAGTGPRRGDRAARRHLCPRTGAAGGADRPASFSNASGMGAVMARLIDSPNVPEWVGPAGLSCSVG